MLMVFGWGLFNLRRLGTVSNSILQENYRSILAADNMIAAIERQDSAVLLILLSDVERDLGQFQENQAEFRQWLENAKNNVTLPGESEQLSAIEQNYQRFLTAFDRASDQNSDSAREDLSRYSQTISPAFLAVRMACRELRSLNQNAMVEASQRTQEVSVQAMISLGVAGTVASLLGVVMSWILSERLVQPLKKMMIAVEQVAEGDYAVDLSVETQDELALLAQEISLMSRKLRAFHQLNVGKIIAEKRRSEAIVSSITDGIVVIDDELKVININPTAARILQVSQDAALESTLSTCLNESEICDRVQHVIATSSQPAESPSSSVLTVGAAGSQRHFTWSITPVTTDTQRQLGVVLLFQDVTRFQELDRLKSEFIATASHELRTPLTGMIMSINLLQEQTDGKLQVAEQDLLTATQQNLERLHRLVNDLLDLSKMESGRLHLSRSPTSVSALCESALSFFAVEATQKQVQIQVQIPESLPLIDVDEPKILEVLTNLISNALRYTDPGGHIWIRAALKEADVQISVTDDGDGIPPDKQAHLFEKFVQVETAKDVGGSGLGLAICSEILKLHEGQLWVESQVGQGSTFFFQVPAVMPHPVATSERL